MYKLFLLAALLSFVAASVPVFADDAPQLTPPTESADTAPVAKGDTKKGTKSKKHAASKVVSDANDSTLAPQSTHERGSGKRAVMALSSLTDKQKSQLQAIYDEKKPDWDALSKQMHALRDAEWKKIKPVLTADQLTELNANKNKARKKKRDAVSNEE